MIYSYRCDSCGATDERDVLCDDRDRQLCSCGQPLTRVYDFSSVTIGIPAGFKTMFSDVHGIPGSPQREQFEKEVKEGKTVYAGPGSRWI